MGVGARSLLTIRASLPRARSAYAIASCDPMESPSGRLWEERTKRRRLWIASTIWSNTGALLVIVRGFGAPVGGVKLVEDLFDAILPGDRLVVDEPELRRSSQAQPRSDLAPEERGRPFERASGRRPRLVVAEDRIHDA